MQVMTPSAVIEVQQTAALLAAVAGKSQTTEHANHHMVLVWLDSVEALVAAAKQRMQRRGF
jgi:hypothetical protein